MPEDTPDPFAPVSLGKISVPVDLAYLRPAQAFTAEIAKMLSYDEMSSNLLELAVEEAFANAVKHFSRKADADESIHLEYRLEGENLVIAIRDRGAPFDIDEVQSYESGDADKPGLGMTLMKKSVDKVELITGRSGKEVRLTKMIPIDAELPHHVFCAGSGNAAKKRRALDIDKLAVRFPTEDDLSLIRKLAWRSCGYEHASLFYDMGKLREMLAGRLYLPVIAVDPASGEAVYHAALSLNKPDDAVSVQGMEFSDPDILCPALPRKGTLILHEIARRRGFDGVCVNVPASSIAAQRNALELPGAAPCAVLMTGASGSFFSAKTKSLAIVHYCTLNRVPATVYFPKRHADIATQIYNWIGLPRTVKTGGESPIPKASDIECERNPDAKYAAICVKNIGMDCVERVHSLLNSARGAGSEVVTVRLALDSPSSPDVADWCEKVGLSFAGIVPAFFNSRDALVMQWIGTPLDMNAAKPFGDKNKKLFVYVRECLGY
jgi:anti-sigma regulatory factor (Ser/Thr protein kinase)